MMKQLNTQWISLLPGEQPGGEQSIPRDKPDAAQLLGGAMGSRPGTKAGAEPGRRMLNQDIHQREMVEKHLCWI